MIDLTPILQVAITLIAALFTTFFIPYIKSKTTAEQREQIAAWISVAVSAAEQIYIGSGRGSEKKAYVLDFLAKQGFTVDDVAIDAMIEAIVYELKEGVA